MSSPSSRRGHALLFALLCAVYGFFPVTAQESGTVEVQTESTEAEPEFNIDSLFDLPPDSPESAGKPAGESTEADGLDLLQQVILSRGFSIEANYNMAGFLAPGSTEGPWADEEYRDNASFYTIPGLQMSADLALDIQLSEALRVQQSIKFEVLDPDVNIKEFFFDYNLAQKVFFRIGQFDLNWGQSHNFQFTNLLTRIPAAYVDQDSSFSPRYLRITVPVGIGGFEGVFSGRFMDNFSTVQAYDLGYGLKYNIIRPRVDMDIGVFHHRLMPLRGFFSLQTTVLKTTELYTEVLVSIPHDNVLLNDATRTALTFDELQPEDVSFSGTVGATQTFFDDKLVLNGEVFYSGEKNASAMEKDLVDVLSDEEKVVGILQGLNVALNTRYQPGGLAGLGFGLSFRWAFLDHSGQIIPAVYLSPAKHLTLSVAVPMALGDRQGDDGQKTYYYTQNPDNSGRPFSVIFAISLSSNYRFGYYE
ncbi:MAG: hypothetical protein LBT00_09530 [Spirochaetaceae bacterium]|jgi:hypothetical protein|nr:hypothetical protein [Spirochaetaceae bacterium]